MATLPVDFSVYTRNLLGDDEYERLSVALAQEPPVSIRYNPWKWKEDFSSSPKETIPWSNDAAYLSHRPSFTFDPLFHAGGYYVQEASSMFVGHVIRSLVPCACVMLDLCAAPGGKSTLARAVLPKGSLLVSNEINRGRSQILAENMTKWGHPDCVVTQNAPIDFMPLKNFFDIILTDVPCSGEGMFRKDEVAINEWSTANVDTCWRRQRSIITDIWECLKPGGILIYSTCTYNTLENEENIHWIVKEYGAEPLNIPINKEWGICGNISNETDKKAMDLPVYRFFPSHVRGEGFFLVVLRKPVNDTPKQEQAFSGFTPSANAISKKPKRGNTDKQPFTDECQTWLVESDNYTWHFAKDTLTAIPRKWGDIMPLLQKHLTVIQLGIPTAIWKGKNWIPHHALAMSKALNQEAFPRVELSYADAITYLRHEAIVMDASVPRGIVLVAYRGLPLGFAKNIGNRANNLYPSEWRIRSGYTPEEVSI